jgi:hypothetical protein
MWLVAVARVLRAHATSGVAFPFGEHGIRKEINHPVRTDGVSIRQSFSLWAWPLLFAGFPACASHKRFSDLTLMCVLRNP